MKENLTPEEQIAVEEEPTPPRKKIEWKNEYYAWVLAIIALLIGGIGIYQRFAFELRPTDLGSFVPWGLWVSTYEYLVWLEVGSLIVFTLLVYVFKVGSNFSKISRILYISALAILSMALILIGLDLGHPFRFWHVFRYPQWSSLMTWMIWLHMIYLVVLLLKLIVDIQTPTPENHRRAAWLSFINLPLGLALVIVAGSVFGVALGRPNWQGSALPLYFLLSALISGTALLVFLYVWFYPDERGSEYLAFSQFLGNILLGALIVGLVAASLMGLVILYPGIPAQAAALRLSLFGPFWWVYWIFHIGLGVIVPIGLLLTKSTSARRIGLAAGLFILTFIAVPLNIIIPPQLAVGVIEKELVAAYQGPGLAAGYFPTLSEWLVTLFAVAFGAIVFLVGHYFLVQQSKKNVPVKEG